MIYKLDFDIANKRVKEETAKNIKYMLEEKFQLEQQIRAGENAQLKLEKLECKLELNMMVYTSINSGF